MAAIFEVEDGSGKTNSNAYCTETEATQYHENHSNPATWTAADSPTRENAIREATQYLDLYYHWKFQKSSSDQALLWPRSGVTTEDGFGIAGDVIPRQVKDACAYLALQVINGDTLIPVQQDEAAIKKFKNVIGPLSQEKEYIGGEKPEKDYSVADKLVAEFITGSDVGIVELTRA